MTSTSPQPPPPPVMVSLSRDAGTLVRDVWSPSELQNLDPKCDVLRASQPDLSMPLSRMHALRFSLVTAPFETLHAKWNPGSTAQEGTDKQKDTIENAKFTVTEVTWETRDSEKGEGVIADQCKKTFWFRFTSVFDTRSFVVERGSSQMLTLIAAVQYSFPHLFVPTESEPSMILAALLCDFFTNNAPTLSSFLPAQYFFLECQEKAVVAFFNALENEINTRRSHEATLLASLQSKVSKKWFSWGGGKSSKKKPTSAGDDNSLAEMITFIDGNAASIPACVKASYLVSMTRKEQLLKLVESAKALHNAYEEEATALGSIATSVSVSPQTNEPVQAWYTGQDPQRLDEAKQAAVQMRRTSGLLQQLVFAASTMKLQVGEPLFRALVDVTRRAAILVASEEQYLEAYLAMKKIVIENEPFVTGKLPLVKGSTASSSPGVVRQLVELHQSYTEILSLWEKQMETQIAYAENTVRSIERKVCAHVFAALSSEKDSFEETHHAQLVSTFVSVSGDAPAPQTIVDLLRPSQPGRLDDILDI